MKLSCMLVTNNVLSVDILAKFQRPFMKPYNFITILHRIKTKSSLDGIMCHVNRTFPLREIYSK